MRVVLIDNHDSFTGNLAHQIATVTGRQPTVVGNDEVPWEQLAGRFDAVVVSPGPGRPQRPSDVGISADAIARATVPVLGVCLGHQVLAHVFGGVVAPAPEVRHGRTSLIHHDGSTVFAGIDSPVVAVRYHSWHVADVPDVLRVSARSDDGLVMALEHRTERRYGVQFHPESVLTAVGHAIMRNFLVTAGEIPTTRAIGASPQLTGTATSAWRGVAPPRPRFHVRWQRLQLNLTTMTVYDHCFAESSHSVWLDSAAVTADRSRFSYLADASGPLAHVLTCVDNDHVRISGPARDTATIDGPLTSVLRSWLRARYVPADAALPFDFQGGYLGYVAYEFDLDDGGSRTRPPVPDSGADPREPLAAWLYADRVVVFDHEQGAQFLVCVVDDASDGVGRRWIEDTAATLRALSARSPEPVAVSGTATAAVRAPDSVTARDGVTAPERVPLPAGHVEVRWRDDHAAYRRGVVAAQHDIRAGDSYEVCLTTQLAVAGPIDVRATYAALRTGNPAPYAALLRFGALAVLSSSPEQFLRVDRRRQVRSRPIKGTTARVCDDPVADDDRAAALAASEKDRAENLMVVDMVRHDLSQVCRPGTVAVPVLFGVERYATVHQLVSTVTGALRDDVDALDALAAAFPAGSITGAPKRRTMQIIARLETGPRGVYSGAIGWIAANGTMELSVAIRVIVVDGTGARMGVGGGVVALSDPDDELAEAQLKARALLDAVAAGVPRARRVRHR